MQNETQVDDQNVEEEPNMEDILVERYKLRERVYSTLEISRGTAIDGIKKLIDKAGVQATMEFLFSPLRYDYSDELSGDGKVQKKEKFTPPHWTEKLSPEWNKPS